MKQIFIIQTTQLCVEYNNTHVYKYFFEDLINISIEIDYNCQIWKIERIRIF